MLLRKGMYELEQGDAANAARRLNGPRPRRLSHNRIPGPYAAPAYAAWSNWKPEWREGYGRLQIAADVTLVGQEGAELAGPVELVRLKVVAEGVRFESLHLPHSVIIGQYNKGGSLTMAKSTVTGYGIVVCTDASLVMEDSRVFGCNSDGVTCEGNMKATR